MAGGVFLDPGQSLYVSVGYAALTRRGAQHHGSTRGQPRLDGQPRRFNELRRLTDGITQRMLSLTLRRLERDGLVSRTVFPTVPPQVEYALTNRGRSLHDVLSRLVGWTDIHLAGIQKARARYDAR